MAKSIRVSDETYESLYKLINEARKVKVYERDFKDISFDTIIQSLLKKGELK